MSDEEEKVEQILQEDAQNKSKARPKVSQGPGKYRHGVMMPSDFMPKEQRKAYQESGEVVRWNMYEQLLSYNEFMQIPEDKQKEVFQNWRETYGFAQIKRKWDESTPKKGHAIQRLMKKYALPRMGHGGHDSKSNPERSLPMKDSLPIKDSLPPSEPINTIQYNREASGEEISNRMLKIAEFLDGNSNYRIRLIIDEI